MTLSISSLGGARCACAGLHGCIVRIPARHLVPCWLLCVPARIQSQRQHCAPCTHATFTLTIPTPHVQLLRLHILAVPPTPTSMLWPTTLGTRDMYTKGFARQLCQVKHSSQVQMCPQPGHWALHSWLSFCTQQHISMCSTVYCAVPEWLSSLQLNTISSTIPPLEALTCCSYHAALTLGPLYKSDSMQSAPRRAHFRAR